MNQQPPPLPFPNGTPLPSRELVSNQQFTTALDVITMLQPYLLLTQRELDSGIPKELDGGVAAAATVTFCKACDRLDSMLDDSSRWMLKENDALYEAMTAHYKKFVELNAEQIKSLEAIRRPSHSQRPSFTTINGEYVAFWGTAAVPGGMILGRGNTPAEALIDFDKAFARAASEQIRFAPASEERLKGTVQPIEEKKKRKKKSGY